MNSALKKNYKRYHKSHFYQSMSGLMILFILGFYVLYPINILKAEDGGESQTNSSEEKQKDDKKDKEDKSENKEDKDSDSSHESDKNEKHEKKNSDSADSSNSKDDSAGNEKDSTKDSEKNNNDNKKSDDANNTKLKHEEPKSPEEPKRFGDNSDKSSAEQSNSVSDSNDTTKNEGANDDLQQRQEPKDESRATGTDEAESSPNEEQLPENSEADNVNSDDSVNDDFANADSALENTANPSDEFQDRYEASPLGDSDNADSANSENTEDPEIANDNTADVENETGSVANTGNNIVQNSETDANSTIASGDGTANANTVTESNITVVGDNYLESVVNIDGQKVGDINLMEELQKVLDNNAGPILLSQNADGSYTIINKNNANLDSDATALANTGANIISSGGGDITTGDASANANIVNLANLTLIGNNWVFEVINVFGEWVGNLIVPAEGTIQGSGGSSFSSVDITNKNTADIENNANTGANTGANILTNASDPSSITTGDAVSSSDVQTVADTTIVKDNWFFLMVNNMGNWVGAVIGWTKDAQEGNTQTYQYDFIPAEDLGNQVAGALHILNQNNATITNDATAVANTGSNIVNGDGTISTGDASALSNIFNFVNASIVGNNWIFGIVNIMGTWKGNLIFSHPGDATDPDGDETGDEGNADGEDGTGNIDGQQEMQQVLTEGEIDLDPEIKVMRASNSPTVRSGESVHNTILVENNGDSPLENVKLTDTIYDPQNAKLGSFEWPIGDLAQGQQFLIEYDLDVNNSINPGLYTFKARASGRSVLDDKIKSKYASLGINLATRQFGYFTPSVSSPDLSNIEPTENIEENINSEDQNTEGIVLGEETAKQKPNIPLLAMSAFALMLSSASAAFIKRHSEKKRNLLSVPQDDNLQ